ncbi:MAG: DUF4920 domain-containing protein [Flavobacteriales bacterium]
MKRNKCFLGVILALVLGGCSVAKKMEYGLVSVDASGAITVADLVTKMSQSQEPQTVTIQAPLSAVCQNAGCWIQVQKPDGSALMVRFKNHFTIPPSTPLGTEAIIHGKAYWDTVSVKALRHYAEDAGKTKAEIDAINKPEFKLNFEGDGIKLLAQEGEKKKRHR